VSNAALADVCSALEFVVLERLDGGFVRMGDYPLPPWFVRVFIQAQNEGVTLTSVFPVLDSFLSDADQFWTSVGDGRLSSEAFMATDSRGEELAIVATAVGTRGRRFLLMQPDASFPERQRVLQVAREQALEHERPSSSYRSCESRSQASQHWLPTLRPLHRPRRSARRSSALRAT
jgi:hypothetical protein